MKKRECPLTNNECEDCKWYRQGIRLVGIEEKQEEYGSCVLHVVADNLEEVHRKVYALQKETGETKNAMALKILVDMKMADSELLLRTVTKMLEKT